MPPFSRTLEEEGACITSFKLVTGGAFDEAGITALLMAPAKAKRRKGEAPISGTRRRDSTGWWSPGRSGRHRRQIP